MPTVIETEPAGVLFDYDDPRPEHVHLSDIARSLSNTCRFGGLCDGFYSVAEHAILVYGIVKDAGFPADVCYAALHHDSHEAYVGDIPTPLKNKFERLAPDVYRGLVRSIDAAICAKLDIDPALLHHDAVVAADAQALLIEAAVLKSSGGVGPQWNNDTLAHGPVWAVERLSPNRAEKAFLLAHNVARYRLTDA